MSPLPKVLVTGDGSKLDVALPHFLVERHGKELEVTAGIEDPSKFKNEKGVNVIKIDLQDKAALCEAFKKGGYERLFLVIPGIEDGPKIGMDGMEAAKEAGIKHIIFLSALTAGTDTIFGKRFKPLEDKVKELGVGYTILRIPVLLGSLFTHAKSIKDEGMMYVSQDPEKPFTPVALPDIAKCTADILAAPEKHNGKIYSLVGSPITINDVAAEFSNNLEKDVKVKVIPYDETRKNAIEKGAPEWKIDALLELFKMMDEGNELTNLPEDKRGDIEAITGEKSFEMADWCKEVSKNLKGIMGFISGFFMK